MELNKVSTSYCVELEPEHFLALLDYENIFTDDGPEDPYELFNILKDNDCDDVEYDGRFGSFIWFTLIAEVDTEEKHKEIIDIIQNYIKICLDWKGTKDAL